HNVNEGGRIKQTAANPFATKINTDKPVFIHQLLKNIVELTLPKRYHLKLFKFILNLMEIMFLVQEA
ncbi:hypothetical protein, partial [Actinobacillus pleuropneumoniae]